MPRVALVLVLLAACSSPEEPDAPEPVEPDGPAWCTDGRTWNLYEPDRATALTTYPDDHWLVDDPTTATGLRFDISSADEALLSEVPPPWRTVVDQLAEGDGWGTTAGVVFRFAGAVDPASLTPDTVAFVAFEPDGPVHIGVDIELTDFPNTVILRPRRPLAPASRAAAAILQGATGDDGLCIRQGPALQQLLSPADAPPALASRYADAMDAMDVEPADVAAMTVFTTSSTMFQSLAVAEDIRARSFAPDAPLTCADASQGRLRCDGLLTVNDYRGPDGVVPHPFDASPQASYALPIAIWLPGPLDTGPWPTVLTGHGLANDRNEGNTWSREALAGMGFAVVSTDAILHGDHPSPVPEGTLATDVIHFFGLGYGAYELQASRLRDNFRQTAWDRLQLLEAINAGLDVDGDGTADVIADPVVFGGASLGGMMGTEIMALAPELEGGLLQIAGGRITSVVAESQLFGSLLQALIPPGFPPESIDRYIPLFQAVADPGDPMSWGRWIVEDRLVGDPTNPPQLLAQYAFEDEIVNNIANTNHAQGLGAPVVGREIWPMPGLEIVDGPISGNLPNGGTAGTQLIDIVTDRSDPGVDPRPVNHAGMPTTHEAMMGWSPFFESLRAREPATLRDVYAD